MSDRLPKLLQMLEKAPGDPFLLYGIAMEHKKAGDFPQALSFLQKTLIADAGYCYAYFQAGQTHELLGDVESAKQAYQDGIAAAARVGDAHARGEIEGALDMLQ